MLGWTIFAMAGKIQSCNKVGSCHQYCKFASAKGELLMSDWIHDSGSQAHLRWAVCWIVRFLLPSQSCIHSASRMIASFCESGKATSSAGLPATTLRVSPSAIRPNSWQGSGDARWCKIWRVLLIATKSSGVLGNQTCDNADQNLASFGLTSARYYTVNEQSITPA